MAATEARVVITATDQTSAAFRSAQRSLGTFSRQAETAAGAMRSVLGSLGVGLSAGAAIQGLTTLVNNATRLADELGNTAAQTGMTVEELSALKFAASQADVEFGALSSGLVKFQRNIAEARAGNKEAQASFLQLGISMKDVAAMNTRQLFLLTAQNISELGSEADKTKAEIDAFGRSGADLDPLFRQGAAGINAGTEAARQFNAVISTESNEANRQLGDNIDKMKAKFDRFSSDLVGRVAPYISAALDSIKVPQDLLKFANLLGQAQLSGRIIQNLRSQGQQTGPARGEIQRERQEQRTLIDTEAATRAETARAAAAKSLAAEAAKAAAARADVMRQEQETLDRYAQQTETDTQRVVRQMTEFQDKLNALVTAGRIAPDEAAMRWQEYLNEALPEVEVGLQRLPPVTESVVDEMSEYSRRAAENMQDAFADFLFDPFEGGIKGMLKSFANMLRRMVAEAAAAQIFGKPGSGGLGDIISGGVSAIFGSFGFGGGTMAPVGGKAQGGAVMGGMPYMVGERGPEMFVPGTSGSIVPNDAMGGSVTVAPVYNIDARGATADLVKALPAILEANTRRAVEMARAAIYDDMSRGAMGRA